MRTKIRMRIPLLLVFIVLIVLVPHGTSAQTYTIGSDIQDAIQTFITPDQADEAEEMILGLVGSAKHKIRMTAYGFTDQQLCNALITAHHRGVDVAIIMDATEAAGRYQQPLVALLQGSGIPMAIGKSPVHHQLIHEKSIIVDDAVVESGSLNFSAGGLQQINEIDIVQSPKRAALFTKYWDELWGYLTR